MASEPEVVVSIVLPSYLEEENLRLLLPRLNATMKKLAIVYEIIVVDTIVPMDQTKLVCDENAVIYSPRSPDNSFGSAVRTGIQAARGQFTLFMDADGSHPPEFIPTLVKEMNSYDVVIASRYVEGGVTENSLLLIWMSRALNFTYAAVLGLKCNDVSNSFKVYRTANLKRLKLICNNFDIVEEILYKLSLKNKNLKIKEVPFSFKKRMFGETKRNLFTFILSYLYTLIKLRFLLAKEDPET